MFSRILLKLSPRIVNLILLVGSYGAGQGSLFIAQTWLIANDRLSLVATFGVHFTMATLGAIFIEAGSITVLARHVARITAKDPDHDQVWRAYSGVSIFRILIAVGIAAAVVVATYTLDMDEFTRRYALWVVPALLVWSINAAGLLDGLKLSGVSGMTMAIPSLFSAVALFAVVLAPDLDAGATLGGAFSLGYIISVLIQFVALERVDWGVRYVRPTRMDIRQAAYDGLALLGVMLPGQLYFRLQIQFSNLFLGTDATALFMYIKQIFVAIAQLIGFVRRIEFSYLVVRLCNDSNGPLPLILKTQRDGTVFSIVLSASMLIVGTIISLYADGNFQKIGLIIALFSPAVVLNSLSLALSQGMAALAQFRPMMMIMFISTGVGTIASLLLVERAGVIGLLCADVFAEVVCVSLLLTVLSRRKQEQA